MSIWGKVSMILVLVMPLLFDSTAAQEILVLNDGDSIVVNANGTWNYYTNADSSQYYDFRKSRWGMTKAQVKVSECSSHVTEEQNEMLFKGTLGTDTCEIIYRFEQDRLYRGFYRRTFHNCNIFKILGFYGNLYLALTEKYGQPYDKQERLFEFDGGLDSLIQDPLLFCATFWAGEGGIYSSWHANNNMITLGLSGGAFMGIEGIGIIVEYSRQGRDVEEQVDFLKLIEDL